MASEIASGKEVTAKEVANVLEKKAFADSELEQLHDILRNKTSAEVKNEVLTYGLPHDFSLYYTATKIPDHSWSDRALTSLIERNPGRAFRLTDLFKKHADAALVSDEARLAVIRKLLSGERNEISDATFEPGATNIAEAIQHLNAARFEAAEGGLASLFDALVKNGAVNALNLLNVDKRSLIEWLKAKELEKLTDKRAFLHFTRIIFEEDPSQLTKGTLALVLRYTSENLPPQNKMTNQILKELNIDQDESFYDFQKAVLDYIEKENLDVDKKDPESLLLRIQLMDTYGIALDDVEHALKRFHVYQTHEKSGLELVQSKLVQVYCYQAFKNNDKTAYKIAETLVVPEYLPVSNISQLILGGSVVDNDTPLGIFNEYIQGVLKKVNPETHRSSAGVLIRAIMTSSLYQNDREFAKLIYEQAIERSIITDELEIADIKKLFKVYGDAFEADDWEKAEPILKEYVLSCLRG